MIGEIFAFLVAVFGGIMPILVRRATLKSDPRVGVFITLAATPPILLLFLLIGGQVPLLWMLNERALFFFSLAGIIHFIMGRTLNWYGIKWIGAVRATQLSRTSVLVAPFLALLILGEGLRINDLLAAVSVLAGALLISASIPEGPTFGGRSASKGLIASLGTAAMWGSSPVFIKMGFDEMDSPLVGTFVASTMAAIGYILVLWRGHSLSKVFTLDRSSLRYVLAVALLSPISVLSRFLALSTLPVVTFAVIAGLGPLFNLIFSYLLIKRLELINRGVVVASILMVLGAYAVII